MDSSKFENNDNTISKKLQEFKRIQNRKALNYKPTSYEIWGNVPWGWDLLVKFPQGLGFGIFFWAHGMMIFEKNWPHPRGFGKLLFGGEGGRAKN